MHVIIRHSDETMSNVPSVKVYDLRQNMSKKIRFGTDKRHKRGGMRQKSVKMSCLGWNNGI